MLRRQSNVFKVATDADLQPSVSYTVTAYATGGVVFSSPIPFSGSYYITMYPGHGFVPNDRFMVSIDPTSYGVIINVNGDILTATTTNPPSVGDALVNLGNDTGATSPNYDGSTIVVYTTPDTDQPITESRVTTNDDGEYDYYHDGTVALWELVRDANGLPVAIIQDAFQILAATNDLTVTGGATITGSVDIGGSLGVTGTLSVSSAVDISTTLNVTGTATLGTVVTPSILTSGNSTLGDASTDVTTCVGRFVPRTITLDPTSNATAGTIGEVVYASTPNKFYGKHTTTATDTNWRLLGT